MDLEGDVVYGGKIAETLGQPFHFNHIVFVVFHPFVLQARRAEDARKTCQDAVRGIDAFYLPFVDEGDAVALARFVDDGVEAMMVIPCSFSRQSIPRIPCGTRGRRP